VVAKLTNSRHSHQFGVSMATGGNCYGSEIKIVAFNQRLPKIAATASDLAVPAAGSAADGESVGQKLARTPQDTTHSCHSSATLIRSSSSCSAPGRRESGGESRAGVAKDRAHRHRSLTRKQRLRRQDHSSFIFIASLLRGVASACIDELAMQYTLRHRQIDMLSD